MTATRRARRRQPAAQQRHAALDGYRGLFVILVILFHLGVTRLSGGWIGINHFFVFSGFLITRILISEHAQTGHIDAVRFYIRRARRVVPAMLIVVGAVLVASVLIGTAEQRKLWGGDALSTLGFFLNWRLSARDDAYFDQFGQPSPLRHAWTLSVEEQFYVVVPFLLLAICIVARRRWMRAGIVMALAGGSALWTAHLAQTAGQSRLYYGTDTRVQALLVGAAVGFMIGRGSDGRRPRPLPRGLTEAMGWIGFAISLSAVFFLSESTQWVYTHGGVLLFAVAAGLIGWSAVDERPSLLNQLMRTRPLPYLGRISYGLYLYHWPIHLWFPLDALPVIVSAGIQMVLTVVVAAASYRYIEAPILAHGLRGLPITNRMRGWSVGAVVAAVVTGSLVLWSSSPPAISGSQPDLVAGQAQYTPGRAPNHVAVLGDSVAKQLIENFPGGSYPQVRLIDVTHEGCDFLDAPMMTGGREVPTQAPCRQARETWPEKVRETKAEVLLVFGWTSLAYPHRSLDGQVVRAPQPGYQTMIEGELTSMLSRLRGAGGRQLQLVTLPCRNLPKDESIGQSKATSSDLKQVRDVVRDPTWINGVMKGWAARHPRDVRVLDLQQATCPQGYVEQQQGIRLFADQAHFSAQASPMIWKWLLPQAQGGYAHVS